MLYKAHLIRDAAFLGVAHGRAETGLRHADDDVGVGRALAIQPAARFLAVCVDVATVDIAVRAGEIDVFHAAHMVTEETRVDRAADAFAVKADDLAGADVTHEGRPHDLEGAGLAADHIAVAELAEAERLDTVLVTACINAVLGHDHEGEATLHHVECMDDIADAVLVRALLDQVRQEFAVGIGLEDGAMLLEVILYLLGIHKVTVTRHSEVAGTVMEEDGLDVVQSFLGGIGILNAADTQVALEFGYLAVGEYLVQKAKTAVAETLAILVKGCDAAAFLPPVLEVVKAVIKQRRGVRDAIYCKNSHATIPP